MCEVIYYMQVCEFLFAKIKEKHCEEFITYLVNRLEKVEYNKINRKFIVWRCYGNFDFLILTVPALSKYNYIDEDENGKGYVPMLPLEILVINRSKNCLQSLENNWIRFGKYAEISFPSGYRVLSFVKFIGKEKVLVNGKEVSTDEIGGEIDKILKKINCRVCHFDPIGWWDCILLLKFTNDLSGSLNNYKIDFLRDRNLIEDSTSILLSPAKDIEEKFIKR